MKLLLTSSGWWKCPSIGDEFIKLVGKKPTNIRILFVITPTKYADRDKYIRRLFRQLKGVNIPKSNITFFQFERKIKPEDIKGINVIFVFGGNTFEYLAGLRKTGLDKVIKAFVKKDGVYVGVSAGSYVACPTIEAASWKHADRNYMKLTDLRGLNLVPFLITAHFEEGLREVITKAANKAKYPVIALTDKQAVLVKGKKTKIIGEGEKNIFKS
ncbi:MAG: Type 1 glutamine amidotransferase-like domain-containing protein [Patescibacteria group bacterium]|jgi:peptidase E